MTTQPVNRNAFIRVYEPGNMARLPMLGLREPKMTSPALILVPGESYSIYVNAAISVFSLIGDPNPYSVGAGVSQFSTTIGTHSIINFTMPSGIPDGVYYTNVGSGSDSNPVEVCNDPDEAKSFSGYFEISHNAILGQFYYPYAPTGYKQKIRMRCTLKEDGNENNFTNYRATNTGKMQTLAGSIQEYIVLETELDRDDHGAAMMLSLHDNIFLNGRQYHRKESSAYKPTPAYDTPVSKGEFGLYDTDSAVLLRC